MMEEISGNNIDKITMSDKIRKTMLDLFRGYPAWKYYGIIESRFKGNLGNIVRDKLQNDGFIDVEKKDERIYYWLTPQGMQLASTLFLKQKARDYGLIGAILVCITIIIGLAHLFLSYFQNPIF